MPDDKCFSGFDAYQKALQACGIQATEKACPLLVPLVEEGWVNHPVTEQVIHIYLDELGEVFGNGARGADVLVLGCTHYPLLRPLLRRVVPMQVQIVDSAESTAQAVAAYLKAHASGTTGALSGSLPGSRPDSRPGSRPGSLHCYATDSVEKFRRLGGRFLGRPLEDIELIDIER